MFTFCGRKTEEVIIVDDLIIKEKEARLIDVSNQYPHEDFDLDNKEFATFQYIKVTMKLSEAKFHCMQCIVLSHISDQITQEDFVEYFPEALCSAQHVEPTPEDTFKIYSKLDKQDTGMTQAKEMFNSYLELFLEEGEINQLLKKFQYMRLANIWRLLVWTFQCLFP